MSNSDSFIDEVTEEVRRDRLFALMRRYGWIAVLAVILIVGGTAWNEWRKAGDRARAQAFGDAVLAAVQSDAPVIALSEINVDQAPGQKAIAGFLAADAAIEAGDTDQAREHLGTIASDATLSATYRQLAQLKLVILAGDDMNAAERDAILAELATPGAPYRVLALEQQALALVGIGDVTGAVEALRALLQEPNLTQGLQARATQLIVSLGEDI